jgi:hypothetical protein
VNPLEDQSRLERWRLKRRLKRAWKRGIAERNARTLGRLSSMTGNDLVLSASPTVEGPVTAGELVFASGTTVRLTPCSRTALRRLADLATNQVAVLEWAADHGRFWGLYFTVAGQRIGVLAREITFVAGSGGLRTTTAPDLLPA